MKVKLYTLVPTFVGINSLLAFVLLSINPSFAQTGIYNYKNKNSKTEIELNLRRDGIFHYQYAQEWSNCITKGKWRPLGSGRVVLTSDYQLDDYELTESSGPKEEAIHLIIQSKGKGQSPTSISKIYINGNENNLFEQDGEAGLKMLEERHKLMASGSQAVQDSLANRDTPRYYIYNGQIAVKSITMVFDKKELILEIKSPKSKQLVLTTAFAPNAAYYYMKDIEFIQSDKFISEAGSTIKLKKQKR